MVGAFCNVVKAVYILVRKNILRHPDPVNTALTDGHDPVRDLLGQIQFVERHDHRHVTFPHQFSQDRQKFQLMLHIQIRSRLI